MSDIRQAMKLIGGVESTPQQQQRVQAIAHSLGIATNDAMFPILVALDVYHGAFSALPAKAREAADNAAKNAADRSIEVINLSVAKAVMNLGPKVSDAIVKVANDINQVDKWKWIGGVVVAVALAFTMFGWFVHATGYSSGFDGGRAEGYKQAADEKAAAAWANTTQGRLAFEVAQAGSLEQLAYCNGKGWRLSKGTCSPQPVTEGKDLMVYGWQVGPSARGNTARKTKLSWWDHLVGNDGKA